MTKYLGIDYGKKNIGLAISDSFGKVAMPFGIIDNNKNFAEVFKKIISQECIDEVVLGNSLNLSGEKNTIQSDIEKFKIFTESLGLKTHFINEVFSSMESKWGTEKKIRREEKKSRKSMNENKVDDKAATMILKTFLERGGMEGV